MEPTLVVSDEEHFPALRPSSHGEKASLAARPVSVVPVSDVCHAPNRDHVPLSKLVVATATFFPIYASPLKSEAASLDDFHDAISGKFQALVE